MGKSVKKHGVKLYSLLSFWLCFRLIVMNLFPGLFVMVKDTADMGLDYLSLTPNAREVSAEEIKQSYENRTESKIFVLGTDADFARLKNAYITREDEKLNAYFDYIGDCADVLLNTAPHAYVLDDEEDSILETAREILDRTVTLSMMWRLTGEEKYAERSKAEILNACAFEDWHPSHFLDTAELSFAVSLGVNWLYDYLDAETVGNIAASVKEKAFDPAKGKPLSQNWWKWSKTNWNSVCYSGLGVASMVFFDYDPDACADFLAETYKKAAYNFETFTPDGVYVEGSGYWEYCTSYLTYFMSTSENLFGTDFGLSDIDGFYKLGLFPLYITGSVAVFNYGDNKKVSVGAPSLYWFSEKLNEPALALYQMQATVESELNNGKGNLELSRECAVGCLWYDKELLNGLDIDKFPRSILLKSDKNQEIAIFRSAFFDKNATYAAMKAGYNYTNHGDLDIGTFVFDSMGERWAEELGPADYGNSGYFVGIIGGGRWKVYAKRAEGQNTLVFNPNAAFEDQYPFATASFTDFSEDKENGGSATLDMSEAYRFAGVKSAKRTFELFNGRTSLRITDTFTCKMPSEVYWFMHTKADIEISDPHTAVLTIGDKQMKATLSANSVGEFRVMEAASLLENVDNRLKGDAAELKKLAVYASGVNSGVIEVTLEPM